MDYFGKSYHPPGTPPGTLKEHKPEKPGKLGIRVVDYTAESFQEKELDTADQCRDFLHKTSVTWVHFQGQPDTGSLEKIGSIFDLHPLALEDVLNSGQRPKVEAYSDQLFITMSMPSLLAATISIDQVSIFLGDGYIISFHAGEDDPFEPLRNRLRKKNAPILRQQADYLLYSILDLIIDQGYPILERFGEEIEAIEDDLLTTSMHKNTLTDIHRIRRELLLLRRNLWPQREVLNNLLRSDNALVKMDTIIYLRDCYDHTIQIMDLIENYRDMAASMIDVYLSSSSHRLNEIMRILTMIATIFIPLTFIVGVYGMNFTHPGSPWAMPELHWYYGYPITWAIMIAIVIGMIFYFKRKHWL